MALIKFLSNSTVKIKSRAKFLVLFENQPLSYIFTPDDIIELIGGSGSGSGSNGNGGGVIDENSEFPNGLGQGIGVGINVLFDEIKNIENIFKNIS
jgi:hypothetical protein